MAHTVHRRREKVWMGFDFLKLHGAQRVRITNPLPMLLTDGMAQILVPQESKELGYEQEPEKWKAIDIAGCIPPADWPWRPQRFIDGKDLGRTVAWLQTRHGHPIPVRLAELGAVVMHNQHGQLRRGYEVVERVISLIVHPFGWEDVESFAIALQEQGFRLLPCQPEELSFSFEEMRRATQHTTQNEMQALEKQALGMDSRTPTIVDGRLDPRSGSFDQHTDPVVGLIKTHAHTYLHSRGLQLLWELQPGERTPAFRIEGKMGLISWYVRLSGQQGEMPDWGVVRLEIAHHFFKDVIQEDLTYLDYLSHLVYTYRCRDTSYSRAPISIYPIQRAEESLGALLSSTETLVQRFYRLTDL